MSFYEEVVNNPWLAAYKCAQDKCDLGEASKILHDLLSRDPGTREYLAGLEFLKALKSQLRFDKFMMVLKRAATRKLIDKLVDEAVPERIIDAYRENYPLAMGYLTILELFPVAGLMDELVERIKALMKLASEKLSGKMLVEFCRALIYGPIASLPVDKLVALIDNVRTLPSSPECLQIKADLATMIPDVYPPKLLQENPLIAEKIGELLRDVAEETLKLVEEDPDKTLGIYSELSLFQTRMNNICRSLNDWRLCKTVAENAGKPLARMFETVGKIYLMASGAGAG